MSAKTCPAVGAAAEAPTSFLVRGFAAGTLLLGADPRNFTGLAISPTFSAEREKTVMLYYNCWHFTGVPQCEQPP